MRFEAVSSTPADRSQAWAALTQVTEWPRWTASIAAVHPLDGDGVLRLGARFRVEQPRLPKLVWEVSELADRTSFAWVATSPGVRTIGRHHLTANSDGTTRISVSIEQSGPLAGLISALTGRRTRRYLQMEADGLARASQSSD
jgi:hypothetical protein